MCTLRHIRIEINHVVFITSITLIVLYNNLITVTPLYFKRKTVQFLSFDEPEHERLCERRKWQYIKAIKLDEKKIIKEVFRNRNKNIKFRE